VAAKEETADAVVAAAERRSWRSAFRRRGASAGRDADIIDQMAAVGPAGGTATPALEADLDPETDASDKLAKAKDELAEAQKELAKAQEELARAEVTQKKVGAWGGQALSILENKIKKIRKSKEDEVPVRKKIEERFLEPYINSKTKKLEKKHSNDHIAHVKIQVLGDGGDAIASLMAEHEQYGVLKEMFGDLKSKHPMAGYEGLEEAYRILEYRSQSGDQMRAEREKGELFWAEARAAAEETAEETVEETATQAAEKERREREARAKERVEDIEDIKDKKVIEYFLEAIKDLRRLKESSIGEGTSIYIKSRDGNADDPERGTEDVIDCKYFYKTFKTEFWTHSETFMEMLQKDEKLFAAGIFILYFKDKEHKLNVVFYSKKSLNEFNLQKTIFQEEKKGKAPAILHTQGRFYDFVVALSNGPVQGFNVLDLLAYPLRGCMLGITKQLKFQSNPSAAFIQELKIDELFHLFRFSLNKTKYFELPGELSELSELSEHDASKSDEIKGILTFFDFDLKNLKKLIEILKRLFIPSEINDLLQNILSYKGDIEKLLTILGVNLRTDVTSSSTGMLVVGEHLWSSSTARRLYFRALNLSRRRDTRAGGEGGGDDELGGGGSPKDTPDTSDVDELMALMGEQKEVALQESAKKEEGIRKRAAEKEIAAAGDAEMRIDQANGEAYSRESFVEEYGGLEEWDAAAVASLADTPDPDPDPDPAKVAAQEKAEAARLEAEETARLEAEETAAEQQAQAQAEAEAEAAKVSAQAQAEAEAAKVSAQEKAQAAAAQEKAEAQAAQEKAEAARLAAPAEAAAAKVKAEQQEAAQEKAEAAAAKAEQAVEAAAQEKAKQVDYQDFFDENPVDGKYTMLPKYPLYFVHRTLLEDIITKLAHEYKKTLFIQFRTIYSLTSKGDSSKPSIYLYYFLNIPHDLREEFSFDQDFYKKITRESIYRARCSLLLDLTLVDREVELFKQMQSGQAEAEKARLEAERKKIDILLGNSEVRGLFSQIYKKTASKKFVDEFEDLKVQVLNPPGWGKPDWKAQMKDSINF